MAAAIRKAAPELLAANAQDLAAGKEKGLSAAMLDRLMLDEKRIEAMAAGIDQVATLPDPVGQIMDAWDRPNGIRIEQIRVPIGTIGIIYESRPNVTADAAVLCFKTGNATILRGGSEAIHSNRRHRRSPRRRPARPSTPSSSSPSPTARASRFWQAWTSGSTSSSRAAARG